MIISLFFLSAIIVDTNSFNSEKEQLNEIIDNDMAKRDIAKDLVITTDQLVFSAYEFLNDIKELEINLTEFITNYDLNQLINMYNVESVIEFEEAITQFDEEIKNLESLEIESNQSQYLIDKIKIDFPNLITIIGDNPNGLFYQTIQLRSYSEIVETSTEDMLTFLKLNFQNSNKTVIEMIEDNISLATSKLFEFLLEKEDETFSAVSYIYNINNQTDIDEFTQLFNLVNNLELDGNDTTELIILKTKLLDLKSIVIELLDGAILQDDILEDLDLMNEELRDDIGDLTIIFIEDIDEERAFLKEESIKSNIRSNLLIVGAFVLSILFTLFISSITSSSMNKLIEKTTKIGEGDMSTNDNVASSKDEFGVINHSVENMRTRLKTLVENISDTSSYLSNLSEDFFSSAEEINSSAEEVASTAQAMSNGANSQTELVSLVNEDINSLIDIINDIVKKIQLNTTEVSQIALQTNILALNAGIEASRAGDYGRGFAVVAENVRKLSDQSKLASERIETVAEEILDKVQSTFNKISSSMIHVVSVSEETAASAEEVAAASEEMTSSIEELSSSAQELTIQAEKSKSMTDVFKYK